MRTSNPGTWSNFYPVFSRQSCGFTLVELVVVLSLISLLLFFSLPRLQSSAALTSNRDAINWITGNIHRLKARAVSENRLYRMHFNVQTGRIWTTHTHMTEDELLTSEQNAVAIPDTIRIVDIERFNSGGFDDGNPFIHFYAKGYSDGAVLHVEEGGHRQYSIFVEPFLTKAKVVDGYQSFFD